MGEWLEPYRDADDEMLRKFRAKGIELNKNGISLKLVPRFQGFMVDYMVAERSKSAIFWHGIKNSDVLQKHWKVQEDNTTYPKCQPIGNEASEIGIILLIVEIKKEFICFEKKRSLIKLLCCTRQQGRERFFYQFS